MIIFSKKTTQSTSNKQFEFFLIKIKQYNSSSMTQIKIIKPQKSPISRKFKLESLFVVTKIV